MRKSCQGWPKHCVSRVGCFCIQSWTVPWLNSRPKVNLCTGFWQKKSRREFFSIQYTLCWQQHTPLMFLLWFFIIFSSLGWSCRLIDVSNVKNYPTIIVNHRPIKHCENLLKVRKIKFLGQTGIYTVSCTVDYTFF